MKASTISELTTLAIRFRDERDWKQFHNPKDMALSLVLESAELIELMQWKNGKELERHLRTRKQELADELADVLFWVLAMSNDFNINLSDAFKRKLKQNARKYPIAKSKGRSNKYTDL